MKPVLLVLIFIALAGCQNPASSSSTTPPTTTPTATVLDGVVTTLAGSTTSGSNDGTGAARFYCPWGVTLSSNDPSRLFVADVNNNMIRMTR